MLKDLDTGLRSYVTDQDWVEKPTLPAPNPLTRTKPPVQPHFIRPIPSLQKRAHSDELHSNYGPLRATDRVKIVAHKKRDRDRLFTNLYRWQTLHAHDGTIREMRFSKSGKYLATGGRDAIIRIWEMDYYLGLCKKSTTKNSPTPTNPNSNITAHPTFTLIKGAAPIAVFRGHQSDITGLSWSKNDFLLSCSVDKTIRLWHPNSTVCIREIPQSDHITCVAFHPTDEQICIFGSHNGFIRMWHLKEHKLLSEAETDDIVTACEITPDGTTALVATSHGRCKLYVLFDEIQGEWQFKHTTQIDVRSRRARNAQGKKICGFRFYGKSDKVMISSNDSRLRLYRMDDKSVLFKFLGHRNSSSRLNASFAPRGRFVLCGSEAKTVHIWELDYSLYARPPAVCRTFKKPAMEEDGSNQHKKETGAANESFVAVHNGEITGAAFAPRIAQMESVYLKPLFSNQRTSGLIIVTASDDGFLRVFGCC